MAHFFELILLSKSVNLSNLFHKFTSHIKLPGADPIRLLPPLYNTVLNSSRPKHTSHTCNKKSYDINKHFDDVYRGDLFNILNLF